MAEISNFIVLKEMGRRKLDIRGFSLFDNLVSMHMGKKQSTITLTVNPETIQDIWANKPLIGTLIVADRNQFDQIKAELEQKEAESVPEV